MLMVSSSILSNRIINSFIAAYLLLHYLLGIPLITKKIVGSDYPSLFGAFYDTPYGGCSSYSSGTMEVIAMDVCLTEYVYNHASKQVSATSSLKYTYVGNGPYVVTIEDFSDLDCEISTANTTYTMSASCIQNGNGFENNQYYGYAAFFDSFPDPPQNYDYSTAKGIYQLGFTSSKCNSYPYSGYWTSVPSYFILTFGKSFYSYDSCMAQTSGAIKFTCDSGVGMLNYYSSYDCSGSSTSESTYSNPKECDDHQDDDETTGDDYFTSNELYLSSYCTGGSDGYTFTPITSSGESSSSSTCFAGSETVTLESGVSKLIADVVVGDRVLASTAQGAFVYSDVIAVPHAKNNDRVMFNEISLANGADIRMTGEHILPVAASCGVDAVFTVIAAKDVAVNSCVMTVNGQSAVVSNNKVAGAGIYTIVTNEEYVVVNGVVASPFAVSHAAGNTFYNVYRAVYRYVPGLFKSSLFQSFHATFASLAMKTW
jgi:hypothetical protein